MEWVSINESVQQWALDDGEHRGIAVVFWSTDHAAWAYVTENNFLDMKDKIFKTKEEAQEAAIVAYVTERIEE
jgi:hypothetical protein